jgi:hypothetical protein
MKFVKKIPPTDKKLSEKLVTDGWRKIKEPKNLLTTILGVCNVLDYFIMFLIIVNAMASSVDILNLFLILFQAPQNSYILNNGFETYVK